MTGHITFWVLEFALCFLFTLNLYMRGRLTMAIGSVLGFLIFGMVIAAIFVLGWGAALLSFLLMWVFVALSKPLAGKIAFRVLGYRTGIESPAYHRSPVEDLMRGKTTVDEMFKRIGEQQQEEHARLASIAARPDIAAVLHEMSLRPKELRKLHFLEADTGIDDRAEGELAYKLEKLHRLLLECRLPDIAWEILSGPNDLRRLIEFHRLGLAPPEIHSGFRQFT